MKTMLASRNRARLFCVVVASSCAAVGCAEQDHSIGWQEIGGAETGAGIDVMAETGVGSDVNVETGVGIDVSGDIPTDVTAGDAGRFTRVWRDDFDTLDPG